MEIACVIIGLLTGIFIGLNCGVILMGVLAARMNDDYWREPRP